MVDEAPCGSGVKEHPTNSYWLEQTVSDVPTDNYWLSNAEVCRLDTLHVEKRRTDWRLGRWTAKRAVNEFWSAPPKTLGEIEILASASGAPKVFLHHKPATVSISLSHRNGTAACAISHSDIELGCDLELVEPRSNVFIDDYFTTQERALVSMASGEERWRTVALLWSGKESALKVLQVGLRIDTRRLVVSIEEKTSSELYENSKCSPSEDRCWHPLQVRHEGTDVLHGWWQSSRGLVKTLLSNPAVPPPIRLGKW